MNLEDPASVEQMKLDWEHKEDTSGSSSEGTAEESTVPAALRRRRTLMSKRSKQRLRPHLDQLATSTCPREVRESVTILEKLAIRVRTRKQYKKWMKALERFAQDQGLGLAEDGDVDIGCCSFLNSLYLKGHQSCDGDKVVAALMHFRPHFSKYGGGKPPRSMKALRGMRAACPGKSRIAHPFCLWAALMTDLALRHQPAMALLVALAISGYLRPREVTA